MVASGIVPRKCPRQAHAQATVEVILEAATTNRIAAVAGVSVGSLYQCFPNEQALAVALVEQHDDLVDEVAEMVVRYLGAH